LKTFLSSAPEKALGFVNIFNRFLERKMPFFVTSGVFAGIIFSPVLIPLSPLVPWLLGFMTLVGALGLKARELGNALLSPRTLLLFFFTAHVAIPLMVFIFSSLIFRNDPYAVTGFMLLYAVPTAISSFIWVGIYRGSSALSLTIILLGSILAPFVVPGTIHLVSGAGINLDTTGMMVLLLFMVGIPTIIGVSINELSRGKIPAALGPWFSPLAKISLFFVVAINSAPVAPQIRFDNPRLWLILVCCFGFSVMSFVCGKLVCTIGKLNRGRQISIFFSCGMRNIGTALALAIEFFPVAAALPAVLAILFQHTNAAIMGRVFLGKKNIPKAESELKN